MNIIKLFIRKIKYRHYGTPLMYDLVKSLNSDDEKTVSIYKPSAMGPTYVYGHMGDSCNPSIDPGKERLADLSMEKNGFKMEIDPVDIKEDGKYIWERSSQRNVLFDFDLFKQSILNQFSVPAVELSKKYTGYDYLHAMSILLQKQRTQAFYEVTKSFRACVYIGFFYCETGAFERLTEYNGFLTEA